jgi:exonuclease VII large subunit
VRRLNRLTSLLSSVVAVAPSNAAELLVPDRRHVLEQLQDITTNLQYYGARHLRYAQDDLREQAEVLDERLKQFLDSLHVGLKNHRQLLEALNPGAILRRGYAIVRHNGRVVRSSRALSAGAIIEVQLATGNFAAAIKHTNQSKDTPT